MDDRLKASIWQQYGAALDTLDDALRLCPDRLWTVQLWNDDEDARYGQFWFIAYHTLFWTDMYLTGTLSGFNPPSPFIRGKLPETPYTQEQIKGYLDHCRVRGKALIEGLTDEQAYQICTFDWMEPTFLELQIYSLRHIQEHAAQLNLVLGEHGVTGQDWVAQARSKA